MLIERRTRLAPNSEPIKRNMTLPQLGEDAYKMVDQTFRLAHLQTQLGYSSQTMQEILPVTTAYYLLSKAHNELGSFGGERIAQAYVIAAMRVYPDIVDEIAVEQYPGRPLNVTSPHDVAICLGERLAGYETRDMDEMTILKYIRKDVGRINEVATRRRNQINASAA